jgi:predicted dehydrogenase
VLAAALWFGQLCVDEDGDGAAATLAVPDDTLDDVDAGDEWDVAALATARLLPSPIPSAPVPTAVATTIRLSLVFNVSASLRLGDDPARSTPAPAAAPLWQYSRCHLKTAPQRKDRLSVTPLRFGLVGTGYWARITHAPALASTDGIEFTAIWGRDRTAAGQLAAAHGATAYDDFDTFVAAVDAVAFAVPPDVQAPIAIRAAAAGKHLLLEKPLALSETDAGALADAVERAQVASVVFFTARFQSDVRAWLADVTARSGWMGASAAWLGRALQDSSPFNTPWRRDKGGLWDVGPHIVSLLYASLGPVASVTADGGLADITHLVLHHEAGATSTATVTLSAPSEAAGAELYLWGESGRSAAPVQAKDPVAALRVALSELTANARSGQVSHPCDARFGRDVVRVLASAQRQLDSRHGLGNLLTGRLR